ncbi:MAG TPA: response regulator, partial [Myxococcaceae bacterium]|nr:response regulator [Myxococcaceae bacterium]
AFAAGEASGKLPEPAVGAALMAVDFLTSHLSGTAGSSDEVAAVEASLRAAAASAAGTLAAAAVISEARAAPGFAERRSPADRRSNPPPPPAPRPTAPPPDASVRISISLLDSILYRLDELVAVKLRLDYQRRQVEEAQETLDGAVSRARLAGVDPARELDAHKRRLEMIRRDLAQEVHFLGILAQELQEDVKEVRMVPLGPVLEPFRRVVRDLASSLGKEASLDIEGEAVRVDKRLLELIRDPLTHLLRNSIDHGVELPDERVASGKPKRASIRIVAESRESQVWLNILDDGRGISVERVKAVALERGVVERERLAAMTEREVLNLIFAPGFSTAVDVTEISGRGVGLDVVRENVGRLGGRIEFYTEPGQGTQFTLCLPLTLAASRGLLVVAGQDTYCIPLGAVEEVISVEPQDLGMAQGHFAVNWGRQATSFVRLEDLLAGRVSARPRGRVYAIILALSDRRLALGVDDLLGQEEVVVKGLGAGTPRLTFVAGATSLADGKLVTVLEPGALMEAAAAATARGVAPQRTTRTATILVADDSLTTRTMMASVLERAGYKTVMAHDGAYAASLLGQQAFDLVVSDVEMPNLDGFGLVKYLRSGAQHAQVPAILVTSLNTPEDRARGAEAGANAYIVKKDFDPSAFLALVSECLEGGAR